MSLSQRDITAGSQTTGERHELLHGNRTVPLVDSSASVEAFPHVYALKSEDIYIKVAGYSLPQHELTPPRWIGEATRRCAELLRLNPNWDSYGAEKISPSIIRTVLLILVKLMKENTPFPDLVPISSGGVQIEWHINNVDLELEVLSPLRFVAYYLSQDDKTEWEEKMSVYDLANLDAPLHRICAGQ